VSDKSNLKLKSGEADVGAYSDHDYVWSGSAFESALRVMGIPQQNAQRLSRELRRGGAVVTVQAGPRRRAAQSILENNFGVVRYESFPAMDESEWQIESPVGRVQVFGEVHRLYPNYVPQKNAPERKAS
jgi:hypothetical protein